jgi:hypothetical protein
LAVAGAAAHVTAQATVFAGIVKAVDGGAVIERDGQAIEASEGMTVLMGDVVRTRSSGSIGVVFRDDAVLSMGPDSAVVIDDYLFEPLEGHLSFIAKILQGTVSFISGQITKLSPESVNLVTPAATIGVRGTRVLVKVDP